MGIITPVRAAIGLGVLGTGAAALVACAPKPKPPIGYAYGQDLRSESYQTGTRKEWVTTTRHSKDGRTSTSTTKQVERPVRAERLVSVGERRGAVYMPTDSQRKRASDTIAGLHDGKTGAAQLGNAPLVVRIDNKYVMTDAWWNEYALRVIHPAHIERFEPAKDTRADIVGFVYDGKLMYMDPAEPASVRRDMERLAEAHAKR